MIQSISDRFAVLRSNGEKALVAFVTAGDPSLDDLPAILDTLVEAGVDVIEVGLPFSDPIADGPVIQASSQRALDRGSTIAQVFQALGHCQIDIPIVLMGYYNSALRVGLSRFAEQARDSGVSGVILSDLPPDEASEWRSVCEANGIDPVFLVAPTSTDLRIESACKASRGFVYAVSRTGVTGARETVSGDATDLVRRSRLWTSIPICVGFGVSTPAQVRDICSFADGAVVGSWLVRLLHESWNGGSGRNEVLAKVRELKMATRT